MSIASHKIQTPRLKIHYLEREGEGDTVILIHGNASSSIFWKDVMRRLPSKYRVIAPDMRGYGDTEDLVIDATRGFGDAVDDILSLMDSLHIQKAHFAGHSMGGGMVFTLLAEFSERMLSAMVINPASPYGFGGTKDIAGTPTAPDFAGSGGGTVNAEFAKLIKEGDRSSDNPQASPRVVMNTFYWKAPFQAPNEEELLDSVLSMKIGDDRYPGDFEASEHYPFVAPGKFGPINAASPKYNRDIPQAIVKAAQKPPVLWVRGSDDMIVSDESMFDFASLGKMGLVPDYPGVDVCPPQPMLAQTRNVLAQYAKNGGKFTEIVMEDTGHSPFIEKPEEFMNHFLSHLDS